MKKKLLHTLTATVCALCCASGLVACGGGNDTSKVSDEAQWKQVIADARSADNLLFSAEVTTAERRAEISIRAADGVQYLNMSNTEGSHSEIWEYYYDGDYVYLNVIDQQLGYDWQKIDASTVTEEFPEPVSFMDKVYSGEMMREMFGVEVNFDDLDKLSLRYADAEYGKDSEKNGADTYVITDGEGDDEITYLLNFNTAKNYLRLTIKTANATLVHQMNTDLVLNVPTESVQMAEED